MHLVRTVLEFKPSRPRSAIPALSMREAMAIIASVHTVTREGDTTIPYAVRLVASPELFPPNYMEAWATVRRFVGQPA